MQRKGITFRPAHHLTWRFFNPKMDADRCDSYDADYFERSPHTNYVVIVALSWCERSGNCVYCDWPEDKHNEDEFPLSHRRTKSAINCRAFQPSITTEDLNAAPCMPFDSWSRTNMVYGRWRRNSRGGWFGVRTKPQLTPAAYKAAEAAGDDNPEGWQDQWFDTYWTCPVYWVEDGQVYHGTIRTHETPRSKAT